LNHLLTNRVMWVAVALAVIAALAYLMIEIGVLGVGPAKGPAGIVYAAAGGYLLGGLLILVRRRWLWMIGATINALVVLFFVSAYQDRPEVFFSPGGLVTKAAQVLLEVCLIYLILTYRRHPRR
jgi:peptidoglycan/LPS O-acetylase OafA/YrhL